MFLKNILLLMFVILTSPCSAEEQERFALYIPSYVLKKDNISGLEIKEVTSSSPSMGYFIFYQIYKPESSVNPFNGVPSTNSI